MVFSWVASFVTLAASTINSRIGLIATGVRHSLRTGRQRQVQLAADGYAQCKKPGDFTVKFLGRWLRARRCAATGALVQTVQYSVWRLQVQFLDKVVVPVLCNDRFFDTTVSTDFFKFVVGREKEFMQRALSLLRGAMRIVQQIMVKS